MMINYQNKLNISDDNEMQEKCGIVAVFTQKLSRNLSLALNAASGIQHRGQQGAGLIVKFQKGYLLHKNNGNLKEVVSGGIFSKLNKPSIWTIVHCRYGTFGGYNKSNLQPCTVKSSHGDLISVVHNGEFAAIDDFKKVISLSGKKSVRSSTSDTYLFTRALSLIKGNNWDNKIVNFLALAKGAFSLIIGINNCLYICRDRFGIRPLIFGQIKNGWMVASETHSFDKVKSKIIREIRNGEIIKINEKGVTVLNKGNTEKSHFCDFEWSYFSRPDSFYPTSKTATSYKEINKWLSVGLFRERTGEIIAQESPIHNASFVVGVPDSGVSVGYGYASQLKLPYRQVIIRDHFDQNGSDRLFMRDDQMNRIKKKVLGKLSLVADYRIWNNAVVVVADDSIVRGNVSAKITKVIFACGAKEVHWIVGFPPIKHKCHLGVSIRSNEELLAEKIDDYKIIAEKLGATSVNYISKVGFIKARLKSHVKIPANPDEVFLQNGGCGGCITGLYPVSRTGHYYFNKKNGSIGANQLLHKKK